MRKANNEDGGRWPIRKDFETDSDFEEACRMHWYVLRRPEAPKAPAGSPAMNAEAYGFRRGLGMAQPEKEAEELGPYEYMQIKLKVRRCESVSAFMEWWYSEAGMAKRRQGLDKHGSKMSDDLKPSQKCFQLFKGENKTFTPWKLEIEILFQTVTVLSVNLGRRVPLLGHEHSFVQYVVAPEHQTEGLQDDLAE